MSPDEDFPQTGIIVPDGGGDSDSMNTLAHAILDDILYNLIHDMVLKTHREEKIARANTAAIIVEQLAAQSEPDELAEPSPPTTPTKKHRIVQTGGAVYENGNVYVIGNPLQTTNEIRCPKCGLPRLLYPAIRPDALPPDPRIKYCKRQPFVNKPGLDIYGQPLAVSGDATPAKYARKNKEKDLLTSNRQIEAGSSFDSPAPSPPTETSTKPAKHVLPHVKCHRCGKMWKVNRLSGHLAKCMGLGGRASGRAAALKINGQASGSQNGSTPPRSRKSTPLPPNKKSPQKRDAEDFGEDEDEEDEDKDRDEDDWEADHPRKKKVKKVVTKKWKSGRVTVNGKAVPKGLVGDRKETEKKVVEKVQKKSEETAGPGPREVSESSQTLSSP